MAEKLLILHGIWNARSWVLPLARRMRALGFDAEIFAYPSVLGGPDAAIPALTTRIRESGATLLLGHSLGGVIALEALRQSPDLPVSRLVCLGSPLCGSQAAGNLVGRGWTAPLLGRSGRFLQRGCQPWTGNTQVGMVAGTVARGVGRLFARFEGESDGTVSLAETRLPGLSDHCTVASSHTGLVFSTAAARQAAAFLRQGRFLPPDQV